MPRPREFKDPLWPEPTPDLWMGRKPLAPWRPPLPSLPPEPKPTELEPYIVDPDNRPVQPPKGRPETGQPVGPMFTKLPRQDQRGAVDKTFNDLVAGARGIQGSVFDTAFDKALRFGSADSMGGIGAQPMTGIVANPNNPLFQQLLKRMPRLATALSKAKPITEYVERDHPDFSRAYGVTSAVPNETTRVAIMQGNPVSGGFGITPEEMKRMALRNVRAPGSSFQSFPKSRGSVADETLAHEGYHALYAGKYPSSQSPNVDPERAFDLMERILKRAGVSDQEILANMVKYAKDPQHGIVDALGRYQAAITGGSRVPR